jgi:glycosyltransferase involved in cell wall biosynthesis
MNVLQLAYKSEITGGEQVLLQLCRALLANGDKVTVVCPEPGQLGKLLISMGIDVEYVAMNKTYNILAALKIRKIIKERNIDIIHTHGMLVNILGRIATALSSKPSNVKCVSTVHLTRDLLNSSREISKTAIFKSKYYYRLLDNFTSRYCSKVVAVSKAVKADLIQQGYREELIAVIPNGIDPSPFDLIKDSAVTKLKAELHIINDETTIAMVARLSPQKDVPYFVEVMAEVCKKHKNVRAFIAGDGPQKELIEEAISIHKLSENIKLLGFRTDVAILLKATDIFALSSRWEGLPISVLEAMACSKAIVATAVDGTAETLTNGETGFLVQHGEVEAMSEKICRLIEDPQLRAELGAAARLELDKKFHIDRVATAHLKLYESVLNDER